MQVYAYLVGLILLLLMISDPKPRPEPHANPVEPTHVVRVTSEDKTHERSFKVSLENGNIRIYAEGVGMVEIREIDDRDK